ncbi:hypothetical protein ACP0HM_30245 [Escherichia coli]
MKNASALWHELGHHLEYSNLGLLEKARSFLRPMLKGISHLSLISVGVASLQ